MYVNPTGIEKLQKIGVGVFTHACPAQFPPRPPIRRTHQNHTKPQSHGVTEPRSLGHDGVTKPRSLGTPEPRSLDASGPRSLGVPEKISKSFRYALDISIITVILAPSHDEKRSSGWRSLYLSGTITTDTARHDSKSYDDSSLKTEYCAYMVVSWPHSRAVYKEMALV